MKQYILSLVLSLCLFFSYSQVGIGTTNPDASAMLDISSTDSGVLVPRVPLTDVTDNTTPVSGPATGLLVWNTNAGVTGGNGVGFYFFNGAQWMPIQQTVSDDADFFEEGGTTAPDAIDDDMFTQGYTAFGKNTADHRVEINEIDNAATRTLSINSSANTASQRVGIYNSLNMFTGSGEGRGIYNFLSGANAGIGYGVYNNIDRTQSGRQTGVYTRIANTGGAWMYGMDMDLEGDSNGDVRAVNAIITNEGDGDHIGYWANLGGSGTGNQTGIYSTIQNDGGGTHRGVHHYFIGGGNSNATGVYNQIFRDGVGAIIGLDNSIGGLGDGAKTGVNNNIGGGGTGDLYGVYNNITGTGLGDRYGTYNEIDPLTAGTHYGLYSSATKSGSFAGYFLGSVSIGTDATNNYVFPASRGTANQIMQTDANGVVTWEDNRPVSTINLYSNATYDMSHGTGGIDLIPMDAGFEPSVYEPSGRVQVKMVIRYYSAIGTNNFQLRAHDGTTETYPITNASGWTFATTQSGGVATSDWVNWNAGTNAHQIHVFGWNNSNDPLMDRIFIRNAYLLVRSQ